MTHPDPELLFGDIAEYVEQAQAHLSVGEVASLAELNDVAAELSARVLALPGAVMEEYAPELDYVVEKMQQLRSEMLEKRRLLSNELDGSEKRLRAVRAYYGSPAAPSEEA